MHNFYVHLMFAYEARPAIGQNSLICRLLVLGLC